MTERSQSFLRRSALALWCALFGALASLVACHEQPAQLGAVASVEPMQDATPALADPAQVVSEPVDASSRPEAASPSTTGTADASTERLHDAGPSVTTDAVTPEPTPAMPDAAPLAIDAGTPDAGPMTQVERCARSDTPAGEHQRKITSSGKPRTFISYFPKSLDPERPAPLVLIFHGANMSAAQMRDLTGFEQLADQHGFIAVFPDGDPWLTWNIRPADAQACGIGELFTNPEADDFRFVEDMISDVARSRCLDRARVFATGFSMGGYFSHHLACQRPELLRAAAPHSSGTYPGSCKGKVPMLMVASSEDPVVDLACTRGVRDLWVGRNGCGADAQREDIKRGYCERQRGCPAHGQVTFCVLDDTCHAWAGRGSGGLFCLADFGNGPAFEDASALIWRFFAAEMGAPE